MLKITNHFHGCNLTKWAAKVHKIVINAPPPPPGTPGRGSSAAKSDKNHSKTLIRPKADESKVTANTAKAKDSGKTDPKTQNPVNDKVGKTKGPEKVSLDELFDPMPPKFRFYGSKGDTENDMSNMDTEGEEHPNPRKRKSGPVLEQPSSEDEDEPAQDQVLVDNLIKANTEALARSQELDLIVRNQEAKFRLLARAGQIPEAEVENLLLAQELTEEQLMEARGESIPSVASGSGPSGSSRSGTTTIDPK